MVVVVWWCGRRKPRRLAGGLGGEGRVAKPPLAKNARKRIVLPPPEEIDRCAPTHTHTHPPASTLMPPPLLCERARGIRLTVVACLLCRRAGLTDAAKRDAETQQQRERDRMERDRVDKCVCAVGRPHHLETWPWQVERAEGVCAPVAWLVGRREKAREDRERAERERPRGSGRDYRDRDRCVRRTCKRCCASVGACPWGRGVLAR